MAWNNLFKTIEYKDNSYRSIVFPSLVLGTNVWLSAGSVEFRARRMKFIFVFLINRNRILE